MVKRTLLAVAVILIGATGCRSTVAVPALSVDAAASGRSALLGPPNGELSALYRLRARGAGGLRLTALTRAGSGRLIISEEMGSAVSVAVWTATGESELFDLREGCRLPTADVSALFGLGALPLPQAARLLAGRLPALGADRVEVIEDGRLLIQGRGWAGVAALMPDPWRVVSVAEATRAGAPGWRVELSRHTGSVPGWLRIERTDGRRVELEILRLQWDSGRELPPPPELAPCPAGAETRMRGVSGSTQFAGVASATVRGSEWTS